MIFNYCFKGILLITLFFSMYVYSNKKQNNIKYQEKNNFFLK